jgi:solute:Na+ symporter, SSS family
VIASLSSVVLLCYAAILVIIGIVSGWRVRRSEDFFVAGRSLGPGLLFSTFLAANIGAGSTIVATGHAYTSGLAAWWWNGSAGLGSLVLAFWIGPRMWQEAARHGFLTVGDFLAHHFGPGVRTLAATVLWLGSFAILCAQLKAASEVLLIVSGVPLAAGALIAALSTAGYFVVGGLTSAARVNVVQLAVKLVGFALAALLARNLSGGLQSSTASSLEFWSGPSAGWTMLFTLGPAFFLSPGLLQKAFGAKDVAAVRRGIAWHGVALLAFAFVPVWLGLAARTLHPGLERPELALPTVLREDLPPFASALGFAALLSASMSAADAVIFMLSTSGARDLYQGLLRRQASDADMLRVARILAVAVALAGFGLTFVFESVASALSFFYALMVVTLFAPIVGGLYFPRAGRWAALAAMLVGVTTLFATAIATGGASWTLPSSLGLLTSGLTYLILAVF